MAPVFQLHQSLQVLDVPDGGAQSLNLAEAFVGALTRQVVPQFGVALVHALYPLTLAFVSFLDERRLEGTLVHAEVSVVVEGGQVRQQPGARAPQRTFVEAEASGVHPGGVDEEGQSIRGLRDVAVLAESSRGRQTEAQVRRMLICDWTREGVAHHVIWTHSHLIRFFRTSSDLRTEMKRT